MSEPVLSIRAQVKEIRQKWDIADLDRRLILLFRYEMELNPAARVITLSVKFEKGAKPSIGVGSF